MRIIALVFLMIANPAFAETWIHVHEKNFTAEKKQNERIVHHIDVGSIVHMNGLGYFNRRVSIYKRAGDYWSLHGKWTVENGRADCRKNALSISPDTEQWQYKQPNGEWWSPKNVARG